MSALMAGVVWMGTMAACAAGGVAGAQDASGVDVSLIDGALRERAVRLLEIDEGGITYSDAAGLVRSEPLGVHVAIVRPDAGVRAPDGGAVLELVDGQRLVGSLAAAGGDETIRWVHPVFGAVEVPLDRVRRVALAAPEIAAAGGDTPATEDVVTLVNGDRLAGFVERIGAAVRLETGGSAVEVPAERAAEVRLANPTEHAAGTVLWLADGSVVRTRGLRTTRLGELRFSLALGGDVPAAPGTIAPREGTDGTPAGWTGQVGLGDLVAVAFDAGELVPLASLRPAEQRPLGERRWMKPVEIGVPGLLGIAEVMLPGPMSASWELPGRARRLALDAELPEAMWTWGDCELVIATEGPGGAAEVLRERLNAERPAARVNIELPEGARRVRVSLGEGAYGPVQDRVVLRRAVVLVEHGEPGA